MTVLHCVFVLWQILVYMNDSVVFINKRYFSTTSLQLLRDRYLGFAPLHKKANKVLRGAFYRIAPCLSLFSFFTFRSRSGPCRRNPRKRVVRGGKP